MLFHFIMAETHLPRLSSRIIIIRNAADAQENVCTITLVSEFASKTSILLKDRKDCSGILKFRFL